MIRQRRLSLAVAVLFTILLETPPAFSQTIWTDATGNWFTAGNWAAGSPPNTTPPDNNTHAEINNGGTAQVNAAGATALSLNLGQTQTDSGTVSIGAGGNLHIVQFFTIGNNGTGAMNISSGGVVTSFYGDVGSQTGAVGTVGIDGAGSSWSVTSDFVVANIGTGTVTITNGGALTTNTQNDHVGSNGNGTLIVDGVGSTWTHNNDMEIGYFNGGTGVVRIRNGGAWTLTDTLEIGTAGNGTLDINSGGTVSGTDATIANVSTAVGTVTVDGAGSSWMNTSTLAVGHGGTASLSITNGGAVSDTIASIGDQAGSSGAVTVRDTGSTWTNSNNLFVGGLGSGTLMILNGGSVFNLNGVIATGLTGAATVDGTGSTWTNNGYVYVGNVGTGTLTIQNGGAVSSGVSNSSIGKNSNGIGTVTVDGAGSTWTNSMGLFVGENGTGMLHIMNGGVVSNLFAQLGSNTGSNGTATVDGTGSTWTNSGTFLVGGSGTGSLTITSGGHVSSGISIVGDNAAGNGTAIVDGAGSMWTPTSLYVGGNPAGPGGPGLLRITNGGTVSAGSTKVWSPGILEIGASYTLNGLLTFNGGTLRTIANTTFTNNADLTAMGILSNEGVIVDSSGNPATANNGFTSTLSGVFSGSAGLTKINPGTIILSNANTYTGDTNINGGSLIVDGSIASNNTNVNNVTALLGGSGTIFGNVLSGGIVSPGGSPGTLLIKGTYTQQSTATLRIEIGGLAANQHDLLQTGAANLDGTLQLLRINNFQPQVGDMVTILTSSPGNVSGTFSNVTGDFTTLVKPQVVYEQQDVFVQFVQGSFNIGGLTPNQLAVAHELNEVAGDPRATDLIDFLDMEPLGNLAHDYDLIAPEELASIYEIGFAQAVVQNNNLEHRMDDIRAGSNGFCASGYQVQQTGGYSKGSDGKTVLDKNPTPAFVPTPENPWGVFVTGSGDFVNVNNNDGNAHGYDITTGDVTVGADYRLGEHFAIGLDGGYSGSTADLVDNGQVTVNGGKIGGYATVYGYNIWGSVIHVDGAIGGGWNSYDTHRTGLQDEAVRGSTNGSEFNAMLAYGGDWHFGCLLLGSWSTLQYTNIHIDKYTESGSLAPLQIQDQNEYSLRGTTGARLAYDIKAGSAIIRPEVRVAWMHESGDQAYPIDARFASGAGDVFTVHGPKIGRDAALVDAGVAVQWSRCCSFYVYYDGVLGRSNYNNNAVSGGVRISF